MSAPEVDPTENRRKMEAGELYYAFTPELVAERNRCQMAMNLYNKSESIARREQIELYQDLVMDETPIPKKHYTMSEEEDELRFDDFPILLPPVMMDYGYNVKLGPNVFVNANSTWIDTCTITLGARTLVGPNCSFYSGTHPLDPTVRNGTRGPETGKPIVIGEDCWLGGNVIVLPGVTIGKGSTVGAGSVVTKDVEPYTCVAGNPARFVRKIEVAGGVVEAAALGPVEVLAGEDTLKVGEEEAPKSPGLMDKIEGFLDDVEED